LSNPQTKDHISFGISFLTPRAAAIVPPIPARVNVKEFSSGSLPLRYEIPNQHSRNCITGGDVQSSPAVANGVVYIGSDDNNVYALNASTGILLWSYTTGGAVTSSPAVANGVVYIGSDGGNVYAFGLTGGSRRKSVSATQEEASKRPDLRTLRPDFNLKASQVAKGGDAD
jgi:outer membrane protein assembly factor BamB